MKTVFLRILQWTWGLPQTLLGAVLYLIHFRRRHFPYRHAIVTEWSIPGSLGVGMFIFLGRHDASTRGPLLAHEYGHNIQSLLLGPLFLPVIGLPSFLWASIPAFKRLRKNKGISYYWLYCEKWANLLAHHFTGEKTPT